MAALVIVFLHPGCDQLLESADVYHEDRSRKPAVYARHVHHSAGQCKLVHLRQRIVLLKLRDVLASSECSRWSGAFDERDVRHDHHRLHDPLQVLLHHHVPMHRHPLLDQNLQTSEPP